APQPLDLREPRARRVGRRQPGGVEELHAPRPLAMGKRVVQLRRLRRPRGQLARLERRAERRDDLPSLVLELRLQLPPLRPDRDHRVRAQRGGDQERGRQRDTGSDAHGSRSSMPRGAPGRGKRGVAWLALVLLAFRNKCAVVWVWKEGKK